MNPSYTAYNKALMSTIMNTLMGIEPPAPKKGTKETSINGRAFAPGKGVQQEVSSDEKEAKVLAHLSKLAAEVKARTTEDLSSSKVRAAMGAAYKYHEDALDGMLRFSRQLKADVEHGETYSSSNKTHAAYIERRIKLNREEAAEKAIPIGDYPSSDMVTENTPHARVVEVTTYPSSDMVTEANEHQAELEAHKPLVDRVADAAFKSAVHSGERANLNYENYSNEELAKWHQQG